MTVLPGVALSGGTLTTSERRPGKLSEYSEVVFEDFRLLSLQPWMTCVTGMSAAIRLPRRATTDAAVQRGGFVPCEPSGGRPSRFSVPMAARQDSNPRPLGS